MEFRSGTITLFVFNPQSAIERCPVRSRRISTLHLWWNEFFTEIGDWVSRELISLTTTNPFLTLSNTRSAFRRTDEYGIEARGRRIVFLLAFRCLYKNIPPYPVHGAHCSLSWFLFHVHQRSTLPSWCPYQYRFYILVCSRIGKLTISSFLIVILRFKYMPTW